MTLMQAMSKFLENRANFCADATVSYYKERLCTFLEWCSAQNLTLYEQINADVLQSYLLYLRSRHIKGTTIHNYFRAIYTMIHFYEDEYDLQHVKKIKLPKKDPALIMPLSEEEVSQLLQAVKTDSDPRCCIRDQIILHLMVDCGLRSSEVRNLRKTDITSGSILIQLSKNEKSRVLPLPETIKTLISQQPAHAGPYLLVDKHGDQLSKNAIKQLFQDLKETSGVPRVHAHLLRHTFATSYMYYYGNLEFLRLYLGHASYDVTQQYVNISSQCLLTDFKVYRIPDCYK
jgi:site-specific recombinase XerD